MGQVGQRGIGLSRVGSYAVIKWRFSARTIVYSVALLACNVFYATGANAQSDTTTTRIVSLVPNLTELAFALGAGDQVVGVSDFCKFPAHASTLPSVGGLVNPGLEATLTLRPTVVLLYRSQVEFASRLAQLNIRSELFQVDTLSDLYSAMGRLGRLTGKTSAAVALVRDIKDGLDTIKRQRPLTGDAETIAIDGLVIVSRDPAGLRGMYQAAEGTFLGEIFKIAGGELAVKGGAATNREDIILADPMLIIDMSGGETSGRESVPSRAVGQWAELSTVRAVRSGQVYKWQDNHSMLLGPSVVNTARLMQGMVDAARKIK